MSPHGGIYERRIFGIYDMNYAFTNVEDGSLDITVLRDGKKVELENVKFERKLF